MIKPVYRIPSMKEINKLPHNGFNVVSTFSGIGGSAIGYRMAGYKVLWANEFMPYQQQVYTDNNPHTFLDKRDVYTIPASDIIKQLGGSAIDIMDGSPPCQAFSIISHKFGRDWSKKKKYGKDKEQHNQDLFFEYIRLVNDLQPKIFIAENVKGLIMGKSKGYFKTIFGQLKKCGYRVQARLINIKYLGVPQNRQRVFIIGVRNDLKDSPVFPKPLLYTYSIKDALERPYKFQNTLEQLALNKNTKAYNAYLKIPIGKDRRFIARLDYHKPAKVVLSDSMSACYPYPLEYRRFDPNELKRLCTFPDDFKIDGSFNDIALGFGNCVPSKATYHISKTLLNILTKHYETT